MDLLKKPFIWKKKKRNLHTERNGVGRGLTSAGKTPPGTGKPSFQKGGEKEVVLRAKNRRLMGGTFRRKGNSLYSLGGGGSNLLKKIRLFRRKKDGGEKRVSVDAKELKGDFSQ